MLVYQDSDVRVVCRFGNQVDFTDVVRGERYGIVLRYLYGSCSCRGGIEFRVHVLRSKDLYEHAEISVLWRYRREYRRFLRFGKDVGELLRSGGDSYEHNALLIG